MPTAVSIPSLGLAEDLVDLGLDEGGTLEVPTDPDRVGWFTGGGRPGGPGPTVVVGHVDSTEGPAVFARLPELTVGDEVVVDDADGGRTRYAVTEVADVPQTPFPTEQVFGATVEDTLRLITCTGPYDAEAGRYTENRVVSAVTVD
ncbi:class F sortase [uncultured Nocardioides sp.]|uniref:class F sortase n=1 Tax=uncultured Nocardioides sp. TaxID=198441 RepID=UPI0026331D77|nr:class F sortase [uncultured Nocardioides sp.]